MVEEETMHTSEPVSEEAMHVDDEGAEEEEQQQSHGAGGAVSPLAIPDETEVGIEQGKEGSQPMSQLQATEWGSQHDESPDMLLRLRGETQRYAASLGGDAEDEDE